MKNISQMLKQAQHIQEKMAEAQTKLSEIEITGEAGGGMVEITLNGQGVARRVKIDPSLASPDDVEILEDLVTAALNDARTRLEAKMAKEMSALTGGVNLPFGMKMPF